MKRQIAIIDCAIKQSSIHCFNRLLQFLNGPLSYHRPPVEGISSLLESQKNDQGYIIFGSASNIEDNLEWHRELAKFCDQKLQEGKPVFGICFGHQLMAHYYGAKVERNRKDQVFNGARKIKWVQDFGPYHEGDTQTIFTAHSFEVKSLPKNMLHICTSEECFYEGLAHKNLPYMGVQGHPEASSYFLQSEIIVKNPDFKDSPLIEKAYQDGPYLLSQFFAKLSQ
jgi:GMP synthase (glutamine-hydrolysing)